MSFSSNFGESRHILLICSECSLLMKFTSPNFVAAAEAVGDIVAAVAIEVVAGAEGVIVANLLPRRAQSMN